MGSALGGLKAGVVASVWFASSISVFNALVLLSFKSTTLNILATYSQCNGSGPSSQTGTAEYCFSTLLYPGIPEYDFIRGFVIAILFALTIGIYFDFIPGSSYTRRTLLGSYIMLIVLLFLGVYGIVADLEQEIAMVAFLLGATAIYAVIFAQLYRRFTREVEFQSQRPNLRIMVDNRNLTGKKRTFSTSSTHKVEAVSEGRPFKEWLVSGGVTVMDSHEPKTKIKVAGDGLLKAA